MTYDITALKRKLLVRYPFFGCVTSDVDFKEDRTIHTAKTNGTTIFYNPDFMDCLSIEQQLFTLSHEVCHIAFDHILRSKGKNQKLWNIATDAVINSLLKKDGLKLIDGVVDIKEAINYSSEQFYEKLLKEEQTSPKQDLESDTHSMWGYEESKEQENNSDEERQYYAKQDELKKMSETEAFEKNAVERTRIFNELRETITNCDFDKGMDSIIRSIDNIGKSKPVIDWRYVLRDSIQFDADWSYKNSYVEDGIVRVNLESKPMSETEIVIDTSGSVSPELLRNFLRECKNIMSQSKVKVGCFDTKFYGFQEIYTDEDVENMTFAGGGDTDFNVAVNAFSKRVDNKIIFTDGKSTIPRKALNAIWIIYGSRKIYPPGGKVIYIDESSLSILINNHCNKGQSLVIKR